MAKFENFLLTFCVPLTLPLSSWGRGWGEGKFQIFLARIWVLFDYLPAGRQVGAWIFVIKWRGGDDMLWIMNHPERGHLRFKI